MGTKPGFSAHLWVLTSEVSCRRWLPQSPVATAPFILEDL